MKLGSGLNSILNIFSSYMPVICFHRARESTECSYMGKDQCNTFSSCLLLNDDNVNQCVLNSKPSVLQHSINLYFIHDHRSWLKR